MKICKTHMINAIILLWNNYYNIVLNTHLFLRPLLSVPYPVIPRKKNNYFLSTSHLVYPFQKKCCIVLVLVDVYLLLDKVRKKEKNTTPMVLHVSLTNERMNNVIVVTVGKIGMNTNLEFNYFVIIILILFAFQRVFCLVCIQHF